MTAEKENITFQTNLKMDILFHRHYFIYPYYLEFNTMAVKKFLNCVND